MAETKPGDPGYSGPLIGIDEICRCVRVSKDVFPQLLILRAPIRKIGRKYVSHSKTITDWWDAFLTKSPPIDPSEITEE